MGSRKNLKNCHSERSEESAFSARFIRTLLTQLLLSQTHRDLADGGMERETLLKGKIKNKKPVPVNGTGLKKKLNSSCDRLKRYRRSDLALGFFGDFFFLGALFLFFLLELVVDEFEDGDFGAVADANAGGDNARVASGRSANFGAMSEKSFCVTCGVVRYAAAWRRDCSVSRLPSVMIFSATGRAAFARVSVVVMRPCSRRFVTRLRSVARRCHGLRPSFDPDLRCRISPVSFLPALAFAGAAISRWCEFRVSRF